MSFLSLYSDVLTNNFTSFFFFLEFFDSFSRALKKTNLNMIRYEKVLSKIKRKHFSYTYIRKLNKMSENSVSTGTLMTENTQEPKNNVVCKY